MYQCGFLWVSWSGYSFPSSDLECFQLLFLWINSWVFSLFWDSHNVYLVCLMVPHKSLKLSSLFWFFFSFCPSEWIISTALFADSFFCLLLSAVESLFWIFQFSYYVIQLQYFCLIILKFFHHFILNLTVFVLCSPELIEHFYYGYFEFSVR